MWVDRESLDRFVAQVSPGKCCAAIGCVAEMFEPDYSLYSYGVSMSGGRSLDGRTEEEVAAEGEGGYLPSACTRCPRNWRAWWQRMSRFGSHVLFAASISLSHLNSHYILWLEALTAQVSLLMSAASSADRNDRRFRHRRAQLPSKCMASIPRSHSRAHSPFRFLLT